MSEIPNTNPIGNENSDISSLDTTAAINKLDLPLSYKELIAHIIEIHSFAKLSYIASKDAFELQIPDPNLLEIDGAKELFSKHLYINLTAWITKGISLCKCVKTDKVYTVPQILNSYDPITKRKNLNFDAEKILKSKKYKKFVYYDNSEEQFSENLNTNPGTLIPITDLPETHPCIEFLRLRGFSDKKDLESLFNQFNTSYCIKESDDHKAVNLYKGLDKSPRGKLVFFIKSYSDILGYQTRFLEKVENNKKYFYYQDPEFPDKGEWIPIAIKNSIDSKFIPLRNVPLSLLHSKYIIGYGTRASCSLLGYSAALKWNKDNNIDPSNKLIGIVEGALDAGKLGAPFCSCFGNNFSKAQAKLVLDNFSKLYLFCDHDNPGSNLEKSIKEQLPNFPVFTLNYPDTYKDIGEINDKNLLNELKNSIF